MRKFLVVIMATVVVLGFGVAPASAKTTKPCQKTIAAAREIIVIHDRFEAAVADYIKGLTTAAGSIPAQLVAVQQAQAAFARISGEMATERQAFDAVAGKCKDR